MPTKRVATSPQPRATQAAGIRVARAYLERCMRTGEKAEVVQFAQAMRLTMAEAKRQLVSAQTAMGRSNLI